MPLHRSRPWNSAWGRVAYAEITSATSSFASEADVSGLSVTWDAVSGRLYRITASVLMRTDATNTAMRVLITDGSNNGLQLLQTSPAVAAQVESVERSVEVSGLSGAQTHKLRASRTTGTGNCSISASTAYPSFISVEDIGPA